MKSVIDAYALAEQNAADPVSSEQAFYQGAIPGLLRAPRSALHLFRPGPVRAAQENGVVHAKGLRQRGLAASGTRDCAPDPARHAVGQGRPGARRRNPGHQRIRHRAPGSRPAHASCSPQSRQQQAQLEVRAPRRACASMRLVLTPEDMQAPSVERAFFLGAGIGYIRVSSFDEKTGAETQGGHRKAGRRPPGGPGARPAQQSRRRGGSGARNRVAVPSARARRSSRCAAAAFRRSRRPCPPSPSPTASSWRS